MFTPAPWRSEHVGPGLPQHESKPALATKRRSRREKPEYVFALLVPFYGQRLGLGGATGGVADGDDGGAIVEEDRRAAARDLRDGGKAGRQSRRELVEAAAPDGDARLRVADAQQSELRGGLCGLRFFSPE